MIRTANPALDAAVLEARVRAEIACTPAAPEHVAARACELELSARMRYIHELLDDVNVRLALSAERTAPRAEVPPRLAKLGPAGTLLIRAMNYAFKAQRESDEQLRAAVRGATAALAAIADLLEGRR